MAGLGRRMLKMLDPTTGWSYSLWLVLSILAGLCSGNHHSNNVKIRVAKNDYARAPVDFGTTYVSTGISNGLRTLTYPNWAGLTAYYQGFTDQYANYTIYSSAKYIKITSAPSDTTKVRSDALAMRGVCVNYEKLIPTNNQSYLGVYLCPLPFEPLQNTYCCGNEYAEYCCEPKDDSLISKIVGPVIVGPLLLFVLSLWFWSCCCKKKEGKEDEEPMQDKVNHDDNQPEEVKVVSRPPSKTKDDGASLGAQSENQTSCTSLGSEGDNGYGSGPLAETKPLDPAYPPTTTTPLNKTPEPTHNQDYQPTDACNRVDSARNPESEHGKDEVEDDLHLSDHLSLYEDPIV